MTRPLAVSGIAGFTLFAWLFYGAAQYSGGSGPAAPAVQNVPEGSRITAASGMPFWLGILLGTVALAGLLLFNRNANAARRARLGPRAQLHVGVLRGLLRSLDDIEEIEAMIHDAEAAGGTRSQRLRWSDRSAKPFIYANALLRTWGRPIRTIWERVTR